MTDAFISVGGVMGRSARAIVPWTGVPVVVVNFAEEVELPGGPVVMKLGNLSLSCVVDASQSGDYALSSSWTLLGGAGGWQKTLGPKATHNDALVRKSDVARDVAIAVGETVVVDASADKPLGTDFFRIGAGPASRVLEQLFAGSPWWVGTDGVTHVGTRPQRDVTNLVELLDADPRLGTATLASDDPTNVLPGCSFTDERLPGGFLIHDVEFVASGGRARAYVTSSSGRDSKLLGLFNQLGQRSLPRARYACAYEYRVVSMTSDGRRVNVQYVPDALEDSAPELPDGVPLPVLPGMAGLSAQLTPGSRVLVAFVAGNPGRPFIQAFGGPSDPGFAPLSLTIDATTAVEIGTAAINAWIGSEEPNATANPLKRFVRYGDVITNTGSPGAMPVVADATNVTISTAGTKVTP